MMDGYFEDLVIGTTVDLGAFTFTAEDIIRFAKAFDPQTFHTDAELARSSPFGALCASGWHTASVWMKLNVAHHQRAAAGLPVVPKGPSPGFRNLRWTKPVYAGDTIRYASELIAKTESRSRPQWGLVTHRGTGVNQNGDLVFSFEGMSFVGRRP
jgi:acyl dehydratase